MSGLISDAPTFDLYTIIHVQHFI